MSRTTGVRQTIAAALITVCLWQSDLWMAAYSKLRAWGDQD